jgi:hypothetical protein
VLIRWLLSGQDVIVVAEWCVQVDLHAIKKVVQAGYVGGRERPHELRVLTHALIEEAQEGLEDTIILFGIRILVRHWQRLTLA